MAQTCEISARNGSIVQFYDGRKSEALKSTDRITGSKHIFGSFDFLMTSCFHACKTVNSLVPKSSTSQPTSPTTQSMVLPHYGWCGDCFYSHLCLL